MFFALLPACNLHWISIAIIHATQEPWSFCFFKHAFRHPSMLISKSPHFNSPLCYWALPWSPANDNWFSRHCRLLKHLSKNQFYRCCLQTISAHVFLFQPATESSIHELYSSLCSSIRVDNDDSNDDFCVTPFFLFYFGFMFTIFSSIRTVLVSLHFLLNFDFGCISGT